jgi:hypothetical protein
MMYPSFYAHVLNGVLLFIAMIMLYTNYSKIIQLEPYKLISITLLLSLTVGIHGLSHLGLEKEYGYNPLAMNRF